MSVLAPKSIESLRDDFPILSLQINGSPITYLDNAATSQKPLAVIRSQRKFYETENANIHRGVHHLSQLATKLYEDTRYATQRFLKASSPYEVIFTKGCTESINLVASGLSSRLGSAATTGSVKRWLNEGDVILVSQLEHHSNIVPWQIAASRVGATVKQIPVTDVGEIDCEAYLALLKTNPVKLVAVGHVSNALGTINPVKWMIAQAHEAGALVLVDGAQAGPHLRVDVQDLEADFYTLSCHKMYAPTGVGVLFGRLSLLENLPAYQGGGDMIHTVDIENGTSYAPLPARFEAGTPNVAGVVGLASAIDYLEQIGQGASDPLTSAFSIISSHEAELVQLATDRLMEVEGVKIYGTAPEKAGIVSFTMAEAHPHDVGTILDHFGVAVRTGHHCCMPLMKRFNLSATTRVSFALYNNREDIDRLIQGVKRVKEMFAA
jgi:cysteine desulfurase/selenocysteine lyase